MKRTYETVVAIPVTLDSDKEFDLYDREQLLELTYELAKLVANKPAGEIQSEGEFSNIVVYETKLIDNHEAQS